MTPQERAFWDRAMRRAQGMTPETRQALLRALQILRDSIGAIPHTDLARLVDNGDVDGLIALVLSAVALDRAFLPYRQQIRDQTVRSFKYFVKDLPGAGRIDGAVGVAFDYLSPNVVTAIRALETKAIQTLAEDIRDVARAVAENGIRDGDGPQTIARELRAVIGIAPSQEQYVENLRRELTDGRIADAERRVLLDRRFNLERLASLSDAERAKRIETIVAQYRKRYIAFNADTNARTATLDAMKLGQRLTWQQAIDKGIVDGTRLKKRWVGVMDSRERPEHVAMEGETVGFDQPFSNGEVVCGDSTYGCRCFPKYFVARA